MGRLSWGSMIAVVKKDGKALQKLENGQGHCTVASQMYCRPRKISRSTARSRRKCSTEAGKKAGALRGRAGSAVQKPERRPGHCAVAPEVQYRSRKTSQGTAWLRVRCIAGRGKLAGALHGRAGSAVQKPENKPGHCTVAPGVQYRSRKTGQGTALLRRECSTEAGKQPRALQELAGKALQKPEIKQAQCKKNRPEQL